MRQMVPNQKSFSSMVAVFCRRSIIVIFCFTFLSSVTSTSQPLLSEDLVPGRAQILAYEFDFTGWTVSAFFDKARIASLGLNDSLSRQQQQRVISLYQELQEQRRILSGSVKSIYEDPSIQDPAATSAHFQYMLDVKNAEFTKVGRLAEVILQSQTSETLKRMKLGWLGAAFPAPFFVVSDLPNQIILSPRSVIEVIADYTLIPSLSISQIESIENSIENSGKFSALVETLGGIATYPAMINSASGFEFLLETIAHEWTHHYLTATPLGIRYFNNSQIRTMNETTASIAGKEIAQQIILHFYPNLLPTEKKDPRMHLVTLNQSSDQIFNFNREMHLTRVTVDMLLANGNIDKAEEYLDQRRQFFWENGYRIRRLNQAYFAFHGSYADSPYSAAGKDPVGAAVRTLRERSRSLGDFLSRISRLSSYDQLVQLLSSY